MGQKGNPLTAGKGGKTRVIIFSSETWLQLQAIDDSPHSDELMFRSRKNGALSRSQIGRIVTAAAKRTGIVEPVSPHWLRHAHASHALERGTPIALVQATLGHANPATIGVYLHVPNRFRSVAIAEFQTSDEFPTTSDIQSTNRLRSSLERDGGSRCDRLGNELGGLSKHSRLSSCRPRALAHRWGALLIKQMENIMY
jgi:hypothetical protein